MDNNDINMNKQNKFSNLAENMIYKNTLTKQNGNMYIYLIYIL